MYDGYDVYHDDILTVAELAELLKIGMNTAYRLVNSGEIKSFRVNNSYRIERRAVTEYIVKKSEKNQR